MGSDALEQAIKQLYTVNLRTAPGERVLVLADQTHSNQIFTPAASVRREASSPLAERIAFVCKLLMRSQDHRDVG